MKFAYKNKLNKKRIKINYLEKLKFSNSLKNISEIDLPLRQRKHRFFLNKQPSKNQNNIFTFTLFNGHKILSRKS